MINRRALVLSAVLLLSFAAHALAQFETRASVPVLSSPYSVALGDFNRDGKLDLAVVAFSSGKVAVLLGNGDGTFRPPTYYDAVASSIASADLRNNGVLDLLLTDNLSNNLQVLLGNGDGTFGASAFYPTPDFPNLIAVGDFNGDHKVDVLTVDQSGFCPCISVLFGNGDGTFQEPPINTMPPDAAVGIGLGDFNRDGKLDLVTVGQFGSASEAGVLLGNGDGTFQAARNFGAGTNPISVAVGDFNGDGRPDLAVANYGSDSVSVLTGNGDGTFQAALNYGAGSNPYSVAVGDFNGDGKPDLAVADFHAFTGSGSVTVLINNTP